MGDGLITGSTITLDSIQFFGTGDASIFLDSISHNPVGSLVIAPLLEGDFNDSSTVDIDDLNLVLFNWNEASGTLPSDWVNFLPADTVGTTELNTVLFNCGNTASIAAVPEPANASWLGLFGLFLLANFRFSTIRLAEVKTGLPH